MNMNQEKFDLTWHTYGDHLREMLHHMLISNELTDVTLVSEDKKHFKAHKIVLSASSTVFKNIISDNHNSNPVIFLGEFNHMKLSQFCNLFTWGKLLFIKRE